MNRYFVITCQLVLSMVCYSQQPITYDNNCLLSEDSLCMVTVDYTDAGMSGEGQIWDFSHVSTQGNYKCRYMISQDSLALLSTDHERLCTYCQTSDSLLLLREESQLHYINYSQPLLSLRFPMQYGDKVQNSFKGDGVYCGRILLRRNGIVKIEADGVGTLIKSEGDTLRNVLRVHTIITASLDPTPDRQAEDLGMGQQEITEKYQWFAPGLRYPVYETISTTYYNDCEIFAIGQTARRQTGTPSRNIPEDSLEQQCQPDDSFTFTLHNDQGRITIDYILKESAKMQFIVCDIMGVLHSSETILAEAGNSQHIINCSGMKPGQYIVYINVNGQVYNSKFTQQ